jgi:L,D-transpeptidase ErfK/SrfK
MRSRFALGLLFASTVALPARAAHVRVPVYTAVAGAEQDYTVAPGDTLWSVSGRFTMSGALLDALNPTQDRDRLRPGMRLRVSDRHIVPTRTADGLVVDLADRTLFWFQHGGLLARYPVGIGRVDWATPPGHYRIVGRREDPIWHVPPSIQDEMRRRSEPVVAVVEPGPDNPLGKYWLQLSAGGYGIHGTNAPGSVGKVATHGCLRLLPEHVERLYREVPDGICVDVIYEPVKAARTSDGRLWLEVHRDVYLRRPIDPAAIAVQLGPDVDPADVAAVVERAWGTPEELPRVAAAAAAAASAP